MASKVKLGDTLCLVGFTEDMKMVVGGAFQMADTHGFPLANSIEEAEKRRWVISFPHYFASAIEHGWDDIQTFGRIREALVDLGRLPEFETIKMGCIAMFMGVAEQMPGANASEIARRMRQTCEADPMAHSMAEFIETKSIKT